MVEDGGQGSSHVCKRGGAFSEPRGGDDVMTGMVADGKLKGVGTAFKFVLTLIDHLFIP